MKDELQCEEYKQIRSEIVDREKAITQLFWIALIASISILSAVSTSFFRLSSQEIASLGVGYCYLFLGPIAIIIPILFVLGSHRRDIHKLSTYVQVFFEEKDMGPMWETRLSEFRKLNRGESLDALPGTFWVIWFLSTLEFFYALNRIKGFACDLSFGFAVVAAIVLLGLLIYGHIKFSFGFISFRTKRHNDWKEVDINLSKRNA